MKAKQLFNAIQENWPAKVICFVMALCIYLFYQVSSLDTKSFVVPLHVRSENGIVPASPYQSEVKVTVRCKKDDAALLRDDDFYAYVSTDYIADDGTYNLQVFTTLSGNALIVDPLEIKLSPEEVTLTVEQQISGFVPVKSLLSGTPAYGYEVKETTVSPAEVKMTGPHRMVETYKRLQTRAVSVEGLSEATDVDVALENPGGFVKLGDTKKVTVHVAIEPVIVERTFDNLTINLINVPSHLEAALSVDTLSLTVQGAQSAIEKYTPSGFVFFANCQGVTSSGVQEIPLTTMIPESFTVSASVPKTVQVRFTERALQQTEPASDTSGEKSE